VATNRIGTRIEKLIADGDWASARNAIEKHLDHEPDDHWLWSRLSAVKHEQRDYQGALEAANKALEIVPDCPLALWSYAGALDMLGRTTEAGKIYARLLRRGLEELNKPDDDAEECWEGPDWTRGLVVDCIFRSARCLEKIGEKDMAVELYRHFLNQLLFGIQGIHSRKDAVARLKKLAPTKNGKPEAAMKRTVKELQEIMG